MWKADETSWGQTLKLCSKWLKWYFSPPPLVRDWFSIWAVHLCSNCISLGVLSLEWTSFCNSVSLALKCTGTQCFFKNPPLSFLDTYTHLRDDNVWLLVVPFCLFKVFLLVFLTKDQFVPHEHNLLTSLLELKTRGETIQLPLASFYKCTMTWRAEKLNLTSYQMKIHLSHNLIKHQSVLYKLISHNMCLITS